MDKHIYFTVNEGEEERKHIGTIHATNDVILNESFLTAIRDHFDDATMIYTPKLERELCINGRVQTVVAQMEQDGLEQPIPILIDVTETWFY